MHLTLPENNGGIKSIIVLCEDCLLLSLKERVVVICSSSRQSKVPHTIEFHFTVVFI